MSEQEKPLTKNEALDQIIAWAYTNGDEDGKIDQNEVMLMAESFKDEE